MATWDCALGKHQVTRAAWTQERHKMHSPSGSVPLQSTWDPKWLRARKCMKHRVHMEECPCRGPWTWTVWTWEVQATLGCGKPSATHPLWALPHTPAVFAVSLPPHSAAEQVSLNKWPPSPPCVRLEIRYWRDLQTEEATINKEERNALEVTTATD